jgi:hypothetical protein
MLGVPPGGMVRLDGYVPRETYAGLGDSHIREERAR